MLLVVALAVAGVPPVGVTSASAGSGGASLSVQRWDRTVDAEHLLSYEVRLHVESVAPCRDAPFNGLCDFKVQAWYHDEHTEQFQATLGSGSVAVGEEPVTVALTREDRVVAPVTFLRVTITPYGASELAYTFDVAVPDALVYPAPDPSVRVLSWERDAGDETLASWELEVDMRGLGSPGAVCWRVPHDRCSYRLRLVHRDGDIEVTQHTVSGVLLTRDSATGHSPRQVVSATDAEVAPVTHLVATITPYGASEPAYTFERPVADPYQYPAPDPSVRVLSWERDAGDETLASWELEVDMRGLGSPGAVCWRVPHHRCSYRLRLVHRDGDVEVTQHTVSGVLLTRDSATGHSPRRVVTATEVEIAPVTHLVATITPYGASEPAYTFERTLSDLMISDVNLVPYLPVAARAVQEVGPGVCDALLTAAGPHVKYRASVNDYYLDCQAAVLAGKVRQVAKLLALAGAAIGAATGTVFVLDKLTQHDAEIDRDGDGIPVPPPAPLVEDLLSDSIQERSQTELAPDDAGTVARRCRQLVAQAELPVDEDGRTPCESLPIFVPGNDVYEAARHDLDAITANYDWVRLTHARRVDREDELEAADWPRPWYRDHPTCKNKPVGTQCDEYPFMASEQSGPRAGANRSDPPEGWHGASLRAVDADDNWWEGNRLGVFKTSCKIRDRGRGTPFLVVPLPGDGSPGSGIPTQTGICGKIG